MTVSGLTMIKAERQSLQTSHSHAHKSRSAEVSFGRFTERRRTPSWCRSGAGRNPRSDPAYSCGTQTSVRVPQSLFWRDVLRHQFDQNLVLRLDLLLQVGDPLLLG
jgi:hypothetical protein